MTNYTDPEELLAVVNELDEEIGAESRSVVHATNLLHRAVHVLVYDEMTGDMYLQQRSEAKDSHPLHWECVGGHLAPGETYESAAWREVEEELGVLPLSVSYLGRVSACDETGFEFIHIYRATINQTPMPNPDEVIDIIRFPPSQLNDLLADGRLVSPALICTLAEI